MTGGFDDYLDDLRGQLSRCADEAAAGRARAVRGGGTGAPRRRLGQWPAPRRALTWAAVLSVGVAALAAGLLMVGDRSATPVSTSGLLATPGAQMLPAFVQPVVPGVSASPSAGTTQMATPPGYSLAAIAAVSPSDVWSVGARGDAGASGALAGVQSHSFVVHYDGVGWHETSVPDVGPLTAVAATSDGEAWALGPAGVILHWAGLQWEPAATAAQNGGAVLRGLAAVAANNVWAVGSAQGTPFATHWNGAAWQTVVLPATPGGGSLNAISGSAADLWAVGAAADATHVLTLHYNGATWSSVLDAGVSDGGLLTVATIAPNDVWAGGDALLQHYDGSQWRDVSQTFSGVREALAGVSSANVWLGAAGGVAHWDGAAWQPVTARQMGLSDRANAQFAALDALSPADVWAAGTLGAGSATSAPLVVHWDGAAWQPVVDAVQSR
jgi:hypothetical protein